MSNAMRGQITKILKANQGAARQVVFNAVRGFLTRHMPAEQAKHATRRYVAA